MQLQIGHALVVARSPIAGDQRPQHRPLPRIGEPRADHATWPQPLSRRGQAAFRSLHAGQRVRAIDHVEQRCRRQQADPSRIRHVGHAPRSHAPIEVRQRRPPLGIRIQSPHAASPCWLALLSRLPTHDQHVIQRSRQADQLLVKEPAGGFGIRLHRIQLRYTVIRPSRILFIATRQIGARHLSHRRIRGLHAILADLRFSHSGPSRQRGPLARWATRRSIPIASRRVRAEEWLAAEPGMAARRCLFVSQAERLPAGRNLRLHDLIAYRLVIGLA